MRVPTEWRTPLAAARLLVLSPFDAKHRRITADNAQLRNRFAAALADRVLIPHAAPGSKTEAFAREVEGWGMRCLELDAVTGGTLSRPSTRPFGAEELPKCRMAALDSGPPAIAR